jgi:hypothetical protein
VRAREIGVLLAAALALSFWMYRGALRGTLISDDLFLLTAPEIQQLSLANLRAILSPDGPVTQTFLNYAPVHALLHVGAIQAFGDWLPGHHALQIVVHALVAVLLACLYVDTGMPRRLALAGAALFLVHPANVEAVAWISQLKTTSSLGLVLGALLLRRRRPAWALLLFVLGLLAKAHAALALPVLAVLEAVARDGSARPHRWRWLGAWAAVLAVFVPLEAGIFVAGGASSWPELESDRWLHLRTILAVAAHYGSMAATGLGLSTEHELAPVRSLADPWWWAGLAGIAILGARLLVTLRRREAEAAWWIWALAAWLPVSQLTLFRHLIADRYLYFVLPGLIGGALLAGRALLGPSLARGGRAHAAQALAAGAVALLALQSAERARVFRHADAYLVDAALHYPEGVSALVLRGKGLARDGRLDEAMDALRAARRRGWSWVGIILVEDDFARLRADPRFPAFARELFAAPQPGPGEQTLGGARPAGP